MSVNGRSYVGSVERYLDQAIAWQNHKALIVGGQALEYEVAERRLACSGSQVFLGRLLGAVKRAKASLRATHCKPFANQMRATGRDKAV
jgi:hypothetical protein